MSKQGPILIIDDDRDDREILREIIDNLKIENSLQFFANGQEALDYLNITTDQPCLILSDVNMPVMDGIELRQRINDDERLRRKSIPFVFLTTTAGKLAVKEAYEMCVQGFFEKPHNFGELQKLIGRIFEYWQFCHHPNN